MLIKNNESIDFFRETGKTTIALGANKDGEVEIVVKDAGKHLVSFLTTAGNKLTQEIDVVTGKLKEIIGQMNEKDIRDSLKKTSSASAKAKSSASKKIIRSSSSTKVNTKYPSSIHGRWEVTKEVYIHKITNRDLCYKTFGGDGDDSFAKEECRDYEKEDDYCVGNAMLYGCRWRNIFNTGFIEWQNHDYGNRNRCGLYEDHTQTDIYENYRQYRIGDNEPCNNSILTLSLRIFE